MYIFNSFYLLYSYDPSVCVLRWFLLGVKTLDTVPCSVVSLSPSQPFLSRHAILLPMYDDGKER